ncbi:5-formyltetrahydrofolate cyclo-ligase [Luteimonas sp. R10]|uniref:5-formyltetrahydrofolate cyclo-ligase n=1 Tax=Luteimonas sp. R10 TaxID=3108176 RepID=UPI00309096FE|nr:5-formyltetrahydrofolate cyclo-ligase [Luteimonas sp. R10]
MTDDRAALRRELRERRRAIPAAARIAAAEAVAGRLQAFAGMPERGYVAGYWAMDSEIALHVWQLRLPKGVVYCLPALGDDGLLRFAPWRPGDPLVTNRYGIPEPDTSPSSLLEADALALAVVPLVGFDSAGNRLGMGAGWYDRSFAFRRERSAPPWLVGAAFSAQRVDALPAAPWDVPLDAVCSETETLLIAPHA